MRSKTNLIIFVVCALILLAGAGFIAYNMITSSLYTSPYEELNADDYITLGEYKGLEYSTYPIEISEEEIQDQIDMNLSEFAETTEVTEGTVEDYSTIKIDYTGTLDGKAVESETKTGESITVGFEEKGTDFDAGLSGKNVGDTVEFKATLPEDYDNTEVAGKELSYKVTIVSMEEENIPEYNVDFVKEHSDCETIEDYEAKVKADLEEEARQEMLDEARYQLMDEATANTEIKSYPENLVEEETYVVEDEYKATADMYGVDWDTFRNEFMGMTDEEFQEQIKEEAQNSVIQRVIAFSILKAEKVKLKEKEYLEYLDKLLADNEYTAEDFEKEYEMTIEEYGEKNDLKSLFAVEKAMDILFENGKEVETEDTSEEGSEEWIEEGEEGEDEEDLDVEFEEDSAEEEEGDDIGISIVEEGEEEASEASSESAEEASAPETEE